MPTNTAEQVDALERRYEQATGVEAVSVEKSLLRALVEGWRNWQMVEAMPIGTRLHHSLGDFWYAESLKRLEGTGYYSWRCDDKGNTPAAALRAALEPDLPFTDDAVGDDAELAALVRGTEAMGAT